MLSRISVVCFAASYGVALLLELTRLLFRSRVRGALMIGFASAGLLAHTVFLVHRGATVSDVPLSSAFDWYLLAAWVLAVAYLFLTVEQERVAIGIFLLPVVLGLIAAAHFADRRPFVESRAEQIWGAIHGGFWLLGTVAVSIGFVAGLMYLIQARRLKRKLPPSAGLRLPSLEWLERMNGRAIVISALMAGAGLLSGIILNLVTHRWQQDKLPWSDPIVWRSGGMFGWLLAAALFNVLYKPARRGRKVAYLTVASFIFLAIFLVGRLFVDSGHGAKGRASEGGDPKSATRNENAPLPLPPHSAFRIAPPPEVSA